MAVTGRASRARMKETSLPDTMGEADEGLPWRGWSRRGRRLSVVVSAQDYHMVASHNMSLELTRAGLLLLWGGHVGLTRISHNHGAHPIIRRLGEPVDSALPVL